MKAVRKYWKKQKKKIAGALGRVERGRGDEGVHELRKRFKKMRALLRLVRSGCGERKFRQENRVFRDAGRPLSEVRDAQVMATALADLRHHFGKRIAPASFRGLDGALEKRHRRIRLSTLRGSRQRRSLRQPVNASLQRIDRWLPKTSRWSMVEKGLRATYRAARRSMKRAERKNSSAAWHECRKRTKDLRYQLEMLAGLEMLEPMAKAAKAITDVLGTDHDLAVLRKIAMERFAETLPGHDAELLAALIEERREGLKEEARRLGGELFAEKPKLFGRRIHRYRKEAKAHGDAAAESD